MRNRQNSYDRTGSSQDFSNNEGFHNYQDYTERNFKNTPLYADRQSQRQDRQGYRNERSDYRSDYRAGSPGYSQPRSGYTPSNTSDASMYGGNDMPRFGGGYQYEQPQNWSQGSQISHPYGQHSLPSAGSQDWGPGSFQSDRFDARYNANYGYGATSTPRQEYESSRFGQGDTRSVSSNAGNFSWQGGQERRSGPHYGKGPKGYRRSDERIREEVSEALSAHGDIDASEIEIEVKDGLITLTGTVESRQMKRLVEDTVESVSGVQDVKNELRLMSSIENTRIPSDSTTDGASSRSSSLAKSGAAGRQSSSSQTTSSSKSVQ